MSIDFKKPSQIFTEYGTQLKSLKPTVNIDQTDSDWYVRGKVLTGVISGVYADQRLIANDAHPQRARRDAVALHLESWLNDSFRAPTTARGYALTTGATGSTVHAGQQYVYDPNGNVYVATQDTPFGSASAVLVPVQSVSTGQGQNLISGAPLTVSSPPAGVGGTATASGDIADGRNAETTSEGAARVLEFMRSKPAGGNESDYKKWAIAADSSVIAANVTRFPLGFGSVGVIVTAGTTDIDQALDNGQDVVLVPSDALVDTVQAALDDQACVTDIPIAYKPTTVEVNVTVNVRFVSGGLTTIPAGQTLNQGQLVQREVKRAIYKTPPGGRKFAGTGYVVGSEIEDTIDLGLSAGPYVFGTLALIVDRQVDSLGSGGNLEIAANQIAIPGVITVIDLGA